MKQVDDWHLTENIEHELGRGDPFAAAVRATRMPMVITDPNQADNPIIFVNKAFQNLTGYEREEIIGRNCRFLQGPETDKDSVSRVRDAICAGEDVDVDLLNYRKDGSTFWNALFLSPVRDRDGSIRFFFASQLDVTDRVDAQHRIQKQKELVDQEVRRQTVDLEAALEAQTLLLHEVDHRVKNNLMMIGSLVRLQMRTIEDPATNAKLGAMLERIEALAAVHRRLYQSDDVTRFDIGEFARTMVGDVLAASGREDIALRTDIDPVNVPATIASPLALIINEVVTNSVKHAFSEERPGKLDISVKRVEGHATVSIADDGIGFQADTAADGLGRTLVGRLSKQIGAEVAWTNASPGTAVSLRFPIEGKRT